MRHHTFLFQCRSRLPLWAEPAPFTRSSMRPSVHLQMTRHLACGYLTPRPSIWTVSRSPLSVPFRKASIVLQCSFSYDSFASDSYLRVPIVHPLFIVLILLSRSSLFSKKAIVRLVRIGTISPVYKPASSSEVKP